MTRSDANVGLSATSRRPPWPRASTGGSPAIGAPIFPEAETMRSRPGFSVTRKSPSGSGSTAHGCRPFAITVTSNAVLDLMLQPRVCPARAGRWSGALAALVDTGVHWVTVALVLVAELSGTAPFAGVPGLQPLEAVAMRIAKMKPGRRVQS